MSATRTQVSLTEEQRHRLASAASARGVTMAELIRRAVDRYLEDDPDPSLVLAHTFGAAPDASAPSRDHVGEVLSAQSTEWYNISYHS